MANSLVLWKAQEHAYQHIQALLLMASISHVFLENSSDGQVYGWGSVSLHCHWSLLTLSQPAPKFVSPLL